MAEEEVEEEEEEEEEAPPGDDVDRQTRPGDVCDDHSSERNRKRFAWKESRRTQHA